MGKGRLEAFSDGVIAIIITIMVLDLKVPHEGGWRALGPLIPVFLSYVLSFVFLGIYWSNHHHLFQAVQRVSGMTLWANLRRARLGNSSGLSRRSLALERVIRPGYRADEVRLTRSRSRRVLQ